MAIRVNGREIAKQAIDYEFQRLVRFHSEHMPAAEVRAQMHLLRKKATEQAVGALLLIEEAARLDIQVPAADVDARIDKMIDNCGGRTKFDALLGKQKLSAMALRRSIEQGRRVDLLIEKITEDVPDPTEEEIKAHYEAHAREYMKADQAQVQHILIKPATDSEVDKSTARSRLLTIRRNIEEGAAFADQAAAHSECPSGRKTGGSLGWITRGSMVPEFDNAIFSMSVGELSEVIETKLGMHLILKTAQEPAAPAPLQEVTDKIRDFLRHVRRGEAIAAFVEELKKKAVIEED